MVDLKTLDLLLKSDELNKETKEKIAHIVLNEIRTRIKMS